MKKRIDLSSNNPASRRQILKSLAVGGGVAAVPETWVKPTLQSVLIPAHARASLNPLSGAVSINVFLDAPTDQIYAEDHSGSILDSLISEAHAQSDVLSAYCERAPERGDGWFRVQVRLQIFGVCFAGVVWEAYAFLQTGPGGSFFALAVPASVTDECGTVGDVVPDFLIGLEEFDDLNAPTSGLVTFFQVGSDSIGEEIRVFPGGTMLSINCVNACTAPSSSSSSSF